MGIYFLYTKNQKEDDEQDIEEGFGFEASGVFGEGTQPGFSKSGVSMIPSFAMSRTRSGVSKSGHLSQSKSGRSQGSVARGSKSGLLSPSKSGRGQGSVSRGSKSGQLSPSKSGRSQGSVSRGSKSGRLLPSKSGRSQVSVSRGSKSGYTITG